MWRNSVESRSLEKFTRFRQNSIVICTITLKIGIVYTEEYNKLERFCFKTF